MRVLLVNTSEKTGGAAVATHRLMEALNNNGVKARMLVADKQTDNINVTSLPHPWLHRLHFLWERLGIWCRLRASRRHLFEIDTASSGTDITHLKEFREADVIHLAWTNQGMLSLGDLRRILRSGKPVVWTLHDLWPVSSICHYARGCEGFRNTCGHCRLLPGGGSDRDLSKRVWHRKARTYARANMQLVCCSRWLELQAKAASLSRDQHVTSIPNPIDTHVFTPGDRQEARRLNDLPTDRKLILFVSQRVTDERKGVEYLIAALDRLVANHPESRDQMAVAILGGHADEVAARLPLPAYALGYVSDEARITSIYRSADVFVLPSLEDNLPNTIMEAMACGVPCVGFKVGGIPEMIDHQRNGYVARYRDTDDLARGLHWTLCEASAEQLTRAAVHKVVTSYSQQVVALRYIEVYNQALAFKNYHL